MSDDPLNLKQLPAVEPPEELWNVLEARLDVHAEQRRFDPSPVAGATAAKQRQWLPMALAAAVSVVAIGLVVVVSNSPVTNRPMQPSLADASQSAGNPIMAETGASNALLLAQHVSGLLEDQLSRVDGGVIDARHIDDLILLESELGWVDELLIERPGDTRLWQQRVSLLDEMNQRYASNDLQSKMLSMSY